VETQPNIEVHRRVEGVHYQAWRGLLRSAARQGSVRRRISTGRKSTLGCCRRTWSGYV